MVKKVEIFNPDLLSRLFIESWTFLKEFRLSIFFFFFLKSIRIVRYYNGAIETVQGETISICYGNKIGFVMFDEMDRHVGCIAVRRGKCNIY